MSLAQGDGPGVLWTPPADVWETTEIGRYVTWLERERGLAFASYDELQRWSVDDLDGLLVDDLGLRGRQGARARTPPCWRPTRCRAPRWFPGARLNFAEHLMGDDDDTDAVAVVAYSQTRERMELSFGDLREQISRARAGLLRLGVQPGERVVAYMPNIPETLVAFAAAASIGAVWASCAPELGARSVVDRLAQLDPAVLLTVDGYGFRDRLDRSPRARWRRSAPPCPSLRHVVHVPYGEHGIPDALPWAELLAERGAARVPARRVRPPAERAVLVRDDGHPEGHRARPRRHPARVLQGARAELGSQARRPPAVVHDDLLDDVARARRGARRALVDRHARRRPGLARSRLAVAARGGDAPDVHGRQPGLPDGLPQGRPAARA